MPYVATIKDKKNKLMFRMEASYLLLHLLNQKEEKSVSVKIEKVRMEENEVKTELDKGKEEINEIVVIDDDDDIGKLMKETRT